jgi:hypothetical protein
MPIYKINAITNKKNVKLLKTLVKVHIMLRWYFDIWKFGSYVGEAEYTAA